jgi:hypothetical protein
MEIGASRAARIRIQHLIVNNDALSGVGCQRRWCGRHNRNGLGNRDELSESQIDLFLLACRKGYIHDHSPVSILSSVKFPCTSLVDSRTKLPAEF